MPEQKQLQMNFASSEDRMIYSVSRLTQDIKKILEESFPAIWVEGEVSNLRQPSSGHIYFTLKDENAQIRGVIFRYAGSRIKFELKDGMHLLCFGKIGVYERDGQYQLYIEKAEPRGLGALQLAFNQLKEKLYKEGLFDAKYKKPIPLLPQRIGVVTSSTGAAIRDILNVLRRRFANVEIVIYPVAVQGSKAAPEISQAIADFNAWGKIEVMIVGRGGGSLEDLWAFNEEIVARAIFKSAIPIISAVGHEIDWTIADYVADLRAPTPSAAAELVIGRKQEFAEKVARCKKDIKAALLNKLQLLKQRLAIAQQSYALKHPEDLARQFMQQVDSILRHMDQAMLRRVERGQQEFKLNVGRLAALNPLAVLSRGYSITQHEGKAVTEAALLKINSVITTRLHKGKITSRIEHIEKVEDK